MTTFFLQVDLPALMMCALCGLGCGLVGGFLVLRRQAMLADSLSHCVLPGLVAAYVVTKGLTAPAMMTGALLACVLAAGLIRMLENSRKVEGGAALGIVFTGFFALGILMLENLVGTRADLDAQHALYGSLELTYWPEPLSWETLPAAIKNIFWVDIVILLYLLFFYRPLACASFDSGYARASGLFPFTSGLLLVTLAAVIAVCAFEAVGSILVLALFVLPAATARQFCDSLPAYLWTCALVGMAGAMGGYGLAAIAPDVAGLADAPSAAGMIAVLLGLVTVASALLKKTMDALNQSSQAAKERI